MPWTELPAAPLPTVTQLPTVSLLPAPLPPDPLFHHGDEIPGSVLGPLHSSFDLSLGGHSCARIPTFLLCCRRLTQNPAASLAFPLYILKGSKNQRGQDPVMTASPNPVLFLCLHGGPACTSQPSAGPHTPMSSSPQTQRISTVRSLLLVSTPFVRLGSSVLNPTPNFAPLTCPPPAARML